MSDLQTHLTEAWNRSVSVKSPLPRVADCAAEIPHDQLVAKRKELLSVKGRCHVSRVYLGFVEQVLEAQQK